MIVEAFGWIAAALSASMSIPQAVQIARSRTDAGVALGMWQGSFACGLSWLIYGLIVGTPQIIWPNALWAAIAAWIIWLVWRARGIDPFRAFGIPLAGSAATIAVYLAGNAFNPMLGSVLFSIGAFIPVAIGQLAQFQTTRRLTDVSGVSGGTMWLNLICLMCWLAYAIPVREIAIICVDTPLLILVVMNLVALHQARRARATTNAR